MKFDLVDGFICESGGGGSSSGSAIMVCGANGEPLTPERLGSASKGNHAYFRPQIGMEIVTCQRGRRSGEELVCIYVIDAIEGGSVQASQVCEHDPRDRNPQAIPAKFKAVAEAATVKAWQYHCRSAYFTDEFQASWTWYKETSAQDDDDEC